MQFVDVVVVVVVDVIFVTPASKRPQPFASYRSFWIKWSQLLTKQVASTINSPNFLQRLNIVSNSNLFLASVFRLEGQSTFTYKADIVRFTIDIQISWSIIDKQIASHQSCCFGVLQGNRVPDRFEILEQVRDPQVKLLLFFKKWAIPASLSFIFVFSIQYS